jgi:hypothetical protein
MKIFRFTTEVQSTKTIRYIIDAETEEAAIKILSSGTERDEGEEVNETIDWETETIVGVKLIEVIEVEF